MCGRYTLSVPLSNLVDAFDIETPDFDYPLRYNIAPTQEAPVIAEDRDSRRMGLLRWGLVPSWAEDPSMGNRMINARSETAAEKPSFRGAFRKRRCIVPADGFFEWEKRRDGEEGKSKVPHWIHRDDGEAFAMAGLWERWGGEEEALHTFTILTTEAAPFLRRIHPRMPVVLCGESLDRWLHPDATVEDLQSLLASLQEECIPLQGAWTATPVSTRVNSPRNDDPACIQKV